LAARTIVDRFDGAALALTLPYIAHKVVRHVTWIFMIGSRMTGLAFWLRLECHGARDLEMTLSESLVNEPS